MVQEIRSLAPEDQDAAIEWLRRNTRPRRPPQPPLPADRLWCGHPSADVERHVEIGAFPGDDLVVTCPHCGRSGEAEITEEVPRHP